jgi:hypothetical protein
MVLSKIQQGIETYKKWLAGQRHHPEIHLWETVQIFQNNWKLDTPDPAEMFDRSLQNPETRRLWQTENWYPKRMMLEFWRLEPMTVRAMFDDLFNETKLVEARIGRFIFGCDALLAAYKKEKIASIENNHYHSDYRMIANYLAFRYPENYAPYHFEVFRRTMEFVQAREIPSANDPARYFKVLRTLQSFLEKDPTLMATFARHLHPRRHFQGKTLLLAADFCKVLSFE